jgi:hypothetical protein
MFDRSRALVITLSLEKAIWILKVSTNKGKSTALARQM